MSTTGRRRMVPTFAFPLLLGLLCAAELEAQAGLAEGSPAAQRASQGSLEEGRYIATYTYPAERHGPETVQHFTGRAFVRPWLGQRFSIELCGESPPVPERQQVRQGGARLDVFTEDINFTWSGTRWTGSVQEGTYEQFSLHLGRPGTSTRLTSFGSARVSRASLTITSVSDGLVAGVFTASTPLTGFEAEFRARDTTQLTDEELSEYQAFADVHCR